MTATTARCAWFEPSHPSPVPIEWTPIYDQVLADLATPVQPKPTEQAAAE
jgi:hypothetical protein